jgi:hypothetical protein
LEIFFFCFFHLFFCVAEVSRRSVGHVSSFLFSISVEYKASRDVSDSPFGHIGPVYMVRDRESTG